MFSLTIFCFQEILSDDDKMESVKTSNAECTDEMPKRSADKELNTFASDKNDEKKYDYNDDIGKCII